MMTENPYQSPRAETPAPKSPRADRSGNSIVKAIWDGVLLQLLLFIFTGLILDGGQLNRMCVVAMIGYWIVAAMLIVRRRKAPTKTDLLFLRWGILPMMFAVPLIAAVVYSIIGVSHLSGLERWF